MLVSKHLIATVLLSSVVMFGLAGCTPEPPDGVKTDVVNFYSDFVFQATSLDPEEIKDVYAKLAEQDAAGLFEGEPSDAVRDTIFQEFRTLNPELFDSLYTDGVSYDVLGAAYSNILLMSLATQGNGVVAEMPLDAVTYDAGDGEYSINRYLITAPVPLVAESLVTPYEGELPPVVLKKTLEGWRVVPDMYLLYEIGVPEAELL